MPRAAPKHNARPAAPVHQVQREGSAGRGYGAKWQRARAAYLRQHPVCVQCEREGKLQAGEVVDHIVPHKGDMHLFWSVSNWQTLCKRHHDRKTATQDGGFGRG